jgi:hypothetical protein
MMICVQAQYDSFLKFAQEKTSAGFTCAWKLYLTGEIFHWHHTMTTWKRNCQQ